MERINAFMVQKYKNGSIAHYVLMSKERNGKQNNFSPQNYKVPQYNLASLHYFWELRKAAACYGLF
jgi:hypothetical protein